MVTYYYYRSSVPSIAAGFHPIESLYQPNPSYNQRVSSFVVRIVQNDLIDTKDRKTNKFLPPKYLLSLRISSNGNRRGLVINNGLHLAVL